MTEGVYIRCGSEVEQGIILDLCLACNSKLVKDGLVGIPSPEVIRDSTGRFVSIGEGGTTVDFEDGMVVLKHILEHGLKYVKYIKEA